MIRYNRLSAEKFVRTARLYLIKPRDQHPWFDHEVFDAVADEAQRRADEASMVLKELKRVGIKPRRKSSS